MPAAEPCRDRRPSPRPVRSHHAALAAALVILACAWSSIGAPGAGGGKGAGGDREALFDRIRSRQAAVHSFRATMVQTRSSPLLVAEAVTEGRFLFEKPDRFRWESDAPERRIVVSDGQTMTIYFPERNEAERREVRDEFAFRMALELMTSGMAQSLPELEKRFRVEIASRDGVVVLTMAPRSGLLKRAVETITVVHPEAGAVPARIVVLGPKGDRLETILRDVELDPGIPADAFRLSLGPRVRVFDAKERKERGIDGP